MATGGATLLPSKEKTNFLRLVALVTDGGALALKTQFDIVFPPLTLGQDLRALGNYRILNRLKNQKVISQAQFDLLFPPPPKVADSSDFDISLFSCLIQNLPALGQHTSQVWKQPGPPTPNDFSLAAEVKRLRYIRNYISHQSSATLSDQDFQDKWQETSDVIQRLCGTVPGINNCIATTLQLSIDPEKEKEYIEKLRKWDDVDDRLEKQEKLMTQALEYLSDQNERIESNTTAIEVIAIDLKDVTTNLGFFEEEVKSTTIKTENLSLGLEKQERKIDAIQADQEIRSKMSSEFKGLMSRSKIYFEEEERNAYVETETYRKSKKIFDSKKIVVLSGHPGEGKTSMAKHLLLERFSPDRCVNLTEPENWRHIDFTLNLIDGILIDDIFGCHVLDENLVKKWEKKLDELSKIIKEKHISVIITCRHYIIEEAKQILRSNPLLKKEYNQLLSSKDLTDEEKMKILKVHLEAEKRQVNRREMLYCVLSHASAIENLLLQANKFLFGFPECANLFARQDDLFEKGSEFFSQPNIFMKKCIHQLYRDEEKFLALIVVWANKGQILRKSELDETNLSDRLTKIAKGFKFKLKNKLTKRLRRSLDFHIDGLLHFSKESGIYSFNHNIICDMVGLVIAEENPDEVLEFCTRGFLLSYITTQSTDDEFKFCVHEYLFEDLASRLIDLMVEERSVEGFLDCGASVLSLNRGGKMESTAKPIFSFDFSIIKHDSFQKERFVETFINALVDRRGLNDIFASEIMEMSGFFLRYGVKIDRQKYFLLSYSVLIGANIFAKRAIEKDLLDKTELSNEEKALEYTMTLLFAVHHQILELVQILLKKNAIVTEEALYIAAHKADTRILKLLLEEEDRGNLQNFEILNGNNGLIVAAKKGLIDAVNCFLGSGYDLKTRNKHGLSALDKAVAFGREDVCKLLVDAGAPFDKPTKTFKRTPLHTAVDKGLISATKCLLEKGANVNTKDHKGFYPIHTAALNRHFEIIHLLLAHDPRQVSLLTKTYGKMSVLKGKTVFHIAIMKKDYELLSVLLSTSANKNVTDWYGRTAFLQSILNGDSTCINMLKDVCDPSIPDKNGFTPLHVAVYKGYFSLVRAICSNPIVNVNARDKYGKTPLHLFSYERFQ